MSAQGFLGTDLVKSRTVIRETQRNRLERLELVGGESLLLKAYRGPRLDALSLGRGGAWSEWRNGLAFAEEGLPWPRGAGLRPSQGRGGV